MSARPGSALPGLAFRAYQRPAARYTSRSCVIDLSANTDFSLYSKVHGCGTLLGTISRDVNGDAGARLFGAKAKAGFRSAVITNNADDDFAIAQIRV